MPGIGIGIGIGVGNLGIQSWKQLFDDGSTYMRKVVRMQGVNEIYSVDVRLTESPGFNGVENIDFVSIYSNAVEIELNLALDGHSFMSPVGALSRTIILETTPVKYYNGAVGGSNIANSITRAPVLDSHLITETPTYKNALVVYSGVNDVSAAGTGLTAYNLFKTYVEDRIAAGWSNVFAYTMTPTTMGGAGAGVEAERNIFNGLLRTDLSTIAGVYILDTDTNAAMNNPDDESYYIDKLHPARLSVNLMVGMLISKFTTMYKSVITPFVDHSNTFTITKTGDGTGITGLQLHSAQKMTVTLDGAAKFYTDAAATLNESSNWNMTGQAVESRYIRCTTGVCNLVIPNNEIGHLAILGSPVNSPTVGGGISDMNMLWYFQVSDKSTFSGSVANLRFLHTISPAGTSGITYDDLSKLRDLSNLNIGALPVLTSIQINKILADFILNKDIPKTQTTRIITITGAVGTGAPTGQGATDKGILAAYRTPLNDGAYSLWTVTTR